MNDNHGCHMRQQSISFLRRLARNERGSVGLQFGLLAVPMIALTGAAIDYSKALDLKGKLQQVVDSAAIAGARLPATTSDNRYTAAEHMLNASLANAKLSDVATKITATNANVTVDATMSMKTNFMAIAGIEKLELKASVSAQSQVENGGVACLIALNESSPDGLHLQGINKVSSKNCWTWVNSSASTAINATGASMGTGRASARTAAPLVPSISSRSPTTSATAWRIRSSRSSTPGTRRSTASAARRRI